MFSNKTFITILLSLGRGLGLVLIGAEQVPDGGTGGVEQLTAVDDQVRLALLGDGHDLGQDGVEVLFARVPVKDVA